jgi:hypothetical protein
MVDARRDAQVDPEVNAAMHAFAKEKLMEQYEDATLRGYGGLRRCCCRLQPGRVVHGGRVAAWSRLMLLLLLFVCCLRSERVDGVSDGGHGGGQIAGERVPSRAKLAADGAPEQAIPNARLRVVCPVVDGGCSSHTVQSQHRTGVRQEQERMCRQKTADCNKNKPGGRRFINQQQRRLADTDATASAANLAANLAYTRTVACTCARRISKPAVPCYITSRLLA